MTDFHPRGLLTEQTTRVLHDKMGTSFPSAGKNNIQGEPQSESGGAEQNRSQLPAAPESKITGIQTTWNMCNIILKTSMNTILAEESGPPCWTGSQASSGEGEKKIKMETRKRTTAQPEAINKIFRQTLRRNGNACARKKVGSIKDKPLHRAASTSR